MAKKITPFKFKKFVVHHDRCAMKVGTDAVILAAWVKIKNIKTILEIGTGSGVISLMLAQRASSDAKIWAIEIGKEEAEQAHENFTQSPWPNKISLCHQPFQSFSSDLKFDLIVSNPPYFINSHLPPSSRRAQARHTSSLSYSELIIKALTFLRPLGTLAVVLPVEEGKHFQMLAEENNLHIARQLLFFSRQGKPQERWFLEFCFKKTKIETEALTLHAKGEEWSDDYKNLTRDFYLKL
jgi:tRNA1Val (adenine37-N6)-methyltransferase